jgi:hypothetical protein
MRQRSIKVIAIVGLSVAALAGCSSSSTPSSTTSGSQALVGTFRLTPGSDTGGTASGSYFQMISPGGTIASGPYFSNPDSTSADKAYTLLTPGTDGGLITGTYQPNPNPPFDSSGNALADAIVQPTKFTALEFGLSTNATDPQTGTVTPVPTIRVKDGKLSGQLEAWSASWNKLNFNQGSPKPNGTSPGLTAPVSGTYNPTTHAFVITWASQVVGGPFNGFTGSWHLEGTFSAKS